MIKIELDGVTVQILHKLIEFLDSDENESDVESIYVTTEDLSHNIKFFAQLTKASYDNLSGEFRISVEIPVSVESPQGDVLLTPEKVIISIFNILSIFQGKN